jgi:hypothetical protein
LGRGRRGSSWSNRYGGRSDRDRAFRDDKVAGKATTGKYFNLHGNLSTTNTGRTYGRLDIKIGFFIELLDVHDHVPDIKIDQSCRGTGFTFEFG